MAIYRYDSKGDILYYTEKKDFYNPTYFQGDFQVEPKDNLVLLKDVGKIHLEYKSDLGELNVTYRGQEYDLVVRCWNPEGG